MKDSIRLNSNRFFHRLALASIVALAVGGLTGCGKKAADSETVSMNAISADGIGAAMGTIILADTDRGLAIRPNLGGMTPGMHGFHVHANPNCGPGDQDGTPMAGLAAGGHLDPQTAGKHEGPNGAGHLGDLPPLLADDQGAATQEVVAPRLKLADIRGHAVIVHQGGDNFADEPEPLGGGGARLACGIVPAASK